MRGVEEAYIAILSAHLLFANNFSLFLIYMKIKVYLIDGILYLYIFSQKAPKVDVFIGESFGKHGKTFSKQTKMCATLFEYQQIDRNHK